MFFVSLKRSVSQSIAESPTLPYLLIWRHKFSPQCHIECTLSRVKWNGPLKARTAGTVAESGPLFPPPPILILPAASAQGNYITLLRERDFLQPHMLTKQCESFTLCLGVPIFGSASIERWCRQYIRHSQWICWWYKINHIDFIWPYIFLKD